MYIAKALSGFESQQFGPPVHHDPPIAIDQSPRFASAKEINAQFCTEMEAAEHTQRALIIEIY